MSPCPSFIRTNDSLNLLYNKLIVAGKGIFKSYTIRQIIRSADPVNYRKAI